MKRSIVLMLVLIGLQALSGVFKDVPESHWAYQAIEDLYSAGIIQVRGEKFEGDQPPTRYEMAVTVYRLKKYLEMKFERDIKAIKRKLAGLDISTIESALEEMRSFKIEVEKTLKNWSAEMYDLKGSFKNLKDEFLKVSSDQENLKMSLNEMNRQIGRIMIDLSNLKKILGVSGEINADAMLRDLNNLKETVTKITEEFKTIKNDLAEKVKIALENTDSTKEMVKDLEKRVSKLEKIEPSVSVPGTLSASVTKVENEINFLANEIEVLKEKISESVKKRSAMEAKIDGLEKAVSKLVADNEILFKDFKDLSSKMGETLKISVDNSARMGTIEGKIDIITDEISKMRNDVAHITRRLETLESNVSELESEFATPTCCLIISDKLMKFEKKFTDSMDKLKNSVETVKTKFDSEMKNYVKLSEFKSLRTSLESTLDSLGTSLASLTDDLEKFKEHFSSTLTELRGELKSVRRSIGEVESIVSNLENEFSDLKKKVEDNSKKIQSLSNNLSDVKEILTGLNTQIEMIKSDLDINSKGLKNLSEKVSNISKEISNLKGNYESILKDLTSFKGRVDLEFKKRDDRIDKITVEVDKLRENLNSSLADLKNYMKIDGEKRLELEKEISMNQAMTLMALVISLISLLGIVLILVTKT